jgi:hypothetical protein
MKYVYGIASSKALHDSDLGMAGLYGAPIHSVAVNGLAAIVSDAVPADYEGMPKPQLVKILAQHQQATERIMAQTSTILPVKFGTVLQERELPNLLVQACADLEQALATVAEHVELELIVMWDSQRVFAQIAQQPEIADLRARAAGLAPEDVQRLQIAVGVLVKQLLDARRAAYLDKIRTALSDIADDVEANVIVNDQVVANLAFLLPITKQAEFDRRVEELDKELGGELYFKVVGPLPPYSFSTVEIDHVLPDDLDWALAQLGIDRVATGEEIRTAYLRQARLHHPDNNPGDLVAGEQFKEDNSAYRLLRYCYAMQQRTAGVCAEDTSFGCDFGHAIDGGLLLINISRSSDLASRA